MARVAPDHTQALSHVHEEPRRTGLGLDACLRDWIPESSVGTLNGADTASSGVVSIVILRAVGDA